MGKTRVRDKTLGLEGGGVEKREECSKNVTSAVSMCIGRIAAVPTLKVGITKEDALRCLSRKFILVRSKDVDKTSASENMRRETKQGLIRKRRE